MKIVCGRKYGYARSTSWRTWEVHFGYYGTYRPSVDRGTRWVIERITPNTAAAAAALWAKRYAITDRVKEVMRASATELVQVRLSARKLDDGRWQIADYDRKKWSFIL